MNEYQLEDTQDQEPELVTEPTRVGRRLPLPVPAIAGITAVLLGGTVLLLSQPPKSATPMTTTPVTREPVSTPSVKTTPITKATVKADTAKTKPETIKGQKVSTPDQTGTQEAQPQQPKVADPFVKSEDSTTVNIPKAPAPTMTYIPDTPERDQNTTQETRTTAPITRLDIPSPVQANTNITRSTSTERATPIIIKPAPQGAAPSQAATTRNTTKTTPQTQPPTLPAPAPLIITRQADTSSITTHPQVPVIIQTPVQPASRQTASKTSTPKPKPSTTQTTTPTVNKANTAPRIQAPVTLVQTPKATIVVTPKPTQAGQVIKPSVKTPVTVVQTPKATIVVTPEPTQAGQVAKPSVKTPVTVTQPPATATIVVTPEPTPAGQVAKPSITSPSNPPQAAQSVLNTAEQWVKDNGVSYGGSASTDGKTVAVLKTSAGDVFANVGETIPETKTTVVSADEKSLVLKVGEKTTRLELPQEPDRTQ